MIPFTHSAQKIDKVDSKNKDMGKSYMIQERVITTFRSGSSQVV